jgi:hypothetical protein
VFAADTLYTLFTLGFRDQFPVNETKKFTGGLAEVNLHIRCAHLFFYHETIIG